MRARVSGTVWYLSGKEMPSGRGQENQVPRWGAHSAGKVYPNSAGVLSRTFSFAILLRELPGALDGIREPLRHVPVRIDPPVAEERPVGPAELDLFQVA